MGPSDSAARRLAPASTLWARSGRPWARL